MQEVEDAVKLELVNELSKNKMLKAGTDETMEVLKNPNAKLTIHDAVALTLDDIKNFKKNMQLLMNPKVEESEKKLIAASMKQIQRILKKIQSDVDEQDYLIFYSYHIGNQTVRNLSMQYCVDKGTIERARKRVIQKMSVLLYPESFMAEIFD